MDSGPGRSEMIITKNADEYARFLGGICILFS